MRDRKPMRASLPVLLLSAALLSFLPRAAMAGWDGTQGIGLGDRIAAEFAASDGNHHRFSFFATKDTLLTVKAKAATGLTLGFSLYDIHEALVPMGAAAGPAGIKAFRIPSTGSFVLDVSADSGSGPYLLTTAGKSPTTVSGQATLSGTTTIAGSFSFGALANSTLDAQVKPASGSAAAGVTIGSLKFPGQTVTITAGARISKVVLPESASYTLGLGGTAAGAVDVLVKVKPPKAPKRTWSFGVVETPAGSVSQVRSDWMGSPHAASGAEAFRHWDADGSVSTSCAKCHSSGGYRDWLGADGTAFEAVNAAAPLGTTVDCDACHNAKAATLSTCLFPSGARVDGLGNEARCMQCHQGRESTVSVDTAIGATADDTMPDADANGKSDLSFKNVHYLAAAATLYGREAQGGYQYAGKSYNGLLEHVDDYRTCIQCHDQHTTELRLTECAQCHAAVTDYASLQAIRMERSVADYDADGSATEGIAGELSGLADTLYAALRDAARAGGHPIAYSGSAYPYFFSDLNDNGTADTGEGSFTYWTPRLLRAAYNLQYSRKDPGAYAHNSRYAMQLLYDSIESLNAVVPVTGFANLVRGDTGHFDALSLAWRDWDKAEGDSDGLVNTTCAQCHSTEGFKTYAAWTTSSTEITIMPPQPGNEGLRCESCHQSGPAAFGQAVPPLRYVASVWFPSSRVGGTKKISNSATSPDPSFVCMTCHQGRNSKDTIDYYITSNATGTSALSFQNVHYLPAGAVLYGKDAQVGYEYTGKTYEAKFTHKDGTGSGPTNGFQCTYCHLTDHTFLPRLTDGTNGTKACQTCHSEAGTDIEAVRKNRDTDYDGNAATTKLRDEVAAFEAVLYTQIRGYAWTTLTHGIRYDGSANPYWFNDIDNDGTRNFRGEDHLSLAGHLDWDDNGRMDTEDANANGTLDAGEDTNGDGLLNKEDANGNKKFDSDWASFGWWDTDIRTAAVKGKMLMAAHDYQISHKEPGGWAHNTKYILQLMYDAIDDLNGGVANDVPAFTRP